MKFFKLVFAELRKIILKPSIFILIGLLIAALSINGFIYNPTIRSNNTNLISGESVTEIRNKFNGNVGTYTKNNYDSKFNNDTNGANAFVIYSKTDNSITKNNLIELVNNIKISYEDFKNEIETQTKEELYIKVGNIKSNLSTLITKLDAELSSTVAKIIMTKNDYDSFQNIVNDFNSSLTNINELSLENEYYILNSKISAKKYINNINNYVNKLKIVKINQKTSEYIEKIYNDALLKLDEQYEVISNFEESTLFNMLKKINTEIAKYFEISNQATKIIQSSYNLNIVNDINNYKNYENYNVYATKYTLNQSEYLFKNKLYSFEVAQVYNSNSTSNFNFANCYDFLYNTMLIITTIIIIYSIILATSSVASEYSSGTIKLLLIRPYSRKKILTGKIVATILFSSFFIVLSAIVSFIIGSIMFGVSSYPILVTISASSSFLISPFALTLIFLLTTLIKCSIYILISILISSLFRNPIASIVVALSFYFAGLICNLFISSYPWAMILPFANFDLFNYFLPLTTASQIGNLFTGNYTLSNIIVSMLYDIIVTTILIIPSYYIFKHNDI